MNSDRAWMYQKKDDHGFLNPAFVRGLKEFMKYVKFQPSLMNGTNIRCPCLTCKIRRFWDAYTGELHILQKGFVKDYYQ